MSKFNTTDSYSDRDEDSEESSAKGGPAPGRRARARAEPPPPGGKKRKLRRRRNHLSCEECRMRKVKCDRAINCSNCQLHNRVCVWKDAAPVDSPTTTTTTTTREAELLAAREEIDHLRAVVDNLTEQIASFMVFSAASDVSPTPPDSSISSFESSNPYPTSPPQTPQFRLEDDSCFAYPAHTQPFFLPSHLAPYPRSSQPLPPPISPFPSFAGLSPYS